MSDKRLLGLILALFFLLGLTYALVTPVFEASDELWHYPMVRHLADGNPLPVQDPNNVGPWKQQASQPPLYYYLAAALTFPIDTSDMEQVRWLNPHVDNGVLTTDGNINLVIHDPALSPWQGTLLAVYLIRIVSVLLGVTAVYLTYRIAREVAPDRPAIALGAAAAHAFTPMFLFISGAVNNDNLVVPLVSLSLLLMIRQVTAAQRPASWRRLLIWGMVIGLAALAKYPGLALLPMALGTIFISRWQVSDRRPSLASLLRLLTRSLVDWLAVIIPFVIIAGWWYYRNRLLYGDWLGWSAFFQVLGVRATSASLAQLWHERWGFMASYWGLFGGVNVPMAEWIYHTLNGVAVLAVAGFLVYSVREMRGWQLTAAPLSRLLGGILDLVVRYFPLIVCLIWSAATVIGLIRWATTTWSSQGRLVFAAIGPLNTLLLVGLVGWLPQRPSRVVAAGLGLFLFSVAALAPWLWIRPAYQPDHYRPPALVANRTNLTFGDRLQLVGSWLDPASIQPGEAVDVVLEWEVLAPMTRNWSVFVHLNDPVLGVPIAQRDMYPRQGLRPTSLLAEGDRYVDYYRLMVPPTAVAPAQLQLVVGLYDFETGERLRRADGSDAAFLAQLPLAARPGEQPNPLQVIFEGQLELAGFELVPRRTRAGEELSLTLYWRSLRPLRDNYTFFAQVVDAATTRWAADDPAPAAGTAVWPVGEVQTVTYSLVLRDDTPAGVYPLIVGAYLRTPDGGFDRLQRLTPEGRLTDDFLVLTVVRVD